MTTARITREDAERLLRLSREARWPFPSSSGSPAPRGRDAGGTLERLAAQRESLVGAARFFIGRGATRSAMELAANVWRLWMMDRDYAGGRAFLAMVLEHGEGAPARARSLVLYGDGLFAFRLGDHAGSRARNEAALEAARESGDVEALALAHLGLSRVALDEGDHRRAGELAMEARRLAKAVAPEMEQAPIHMHAQATRRAGDHEAAAALFRESLALSRSIGDQGMVWVELENLGIVEIHRGNVAAAEACFAEASGQGDDADPYGVAMRELQHGLIAHARGDFERAGQHLQRIDAGIAATGVRLATDDRFEVEWLRDRLAEATAKGRASP